MADSKSAAVPPWRESAAALRRFGTRDARSFLDAETTLGKRQRAGALHDAGALLDTPPCYGMLNVPETRNAFTLDG